MASFVIWRLTRFVVILQGQKKFVSLGGNGMGRWRWGWKAVIFFSFFFFPILLILREKVWGPHLPPKVILHANCSPQLTTPPSLGFLSILYSLSLQSILNTIINLLIKIK